MNAGKPSVLATRSHLGVTLVADLVFDGETTETPLSIVLAGTRRCSPCR